jgi:hypothetical protein
LHYSLEAACENITAGVKMEIPAKSLLLFLGKTAVLPSLDGVTCSRPTPKIPS